MCVIIVVIVILLLLYSYVNVNAEFLLKMKLKLNMFINILDTKNNSFREVNLVMSLLSYRWRLPGSERGCAKASQVDC